MTFTLPTCLYLLLYWALTSYNENESPKTTSGFLYSIFQYNINIAGNGIVLIRHTHILHVSLLSF